MPPTDENKNNKKEILTTPEKLSEILSEKYFQKILKNEFDDPFEIIKFETKLALQPGENFASKMYRIEMKLKLRKESECNNNELITETSYLLKILPFEENSPAFNLIDELNLFPKEREMYSSILPKLENIYLNKTGEKVSFSPKCINSNMRPESIILEDLKLRKFSNVPRQNGMDEKHVKEVLRKLAQFHAASVCLYEREGPFPEIFNVGRYTRSMEKFRKSRDTNRNIYVECAKKWNIDEKYIKYLDEITKTTQDKMKTADQINVDEFNVLNHGDLWSNNIMFNYDENGNIKETLFVDLQLCKWGSPAQDLYYFLISSSAHDIKTTKFDYFIQFYYNELISNLSKLKYSKLPSFSEIQEQMDKKSIFGLNASMGVMAVVVLDPTDDASINNFLDSGEKGKQFKEQIYSNLRYTREMKTLLPFFEKKGVFKNNVNK